MTLLTQSAVSDTKPIFAAAFSSLGSIPSHLIPLLILILEQSHSTDTLDASFVASTLLIGVFIGILTFVRMPLRLVDIKIISLLVLGQLGILTLSLAISTSKLYVVWFIVGLISGALIQTGSIIIAHSPYSSTLYLLRVSYSLIFSGVILISIFFFEGNHYNDFAFCFLIFLILFLIFINIKRPSIKISGAINRSNKIQSRIFDFFGIFMIAILFAGQIAFISHIAKNIYVIKEVILVFSLYFGVSKLIAGLFCFILYQLEFTESLFKIVISSLLMIVAILGIKLGYGGLLFIFLVFIYDVAFCVFASGLMGRVAMRSNADAKGMIMVSCQLGTMVGPALGGWFVVSFGTGVLASIALTSAILAIGWVLLISRSIRLDILVGRR